MRRLSTASLLVFLAACSGAPAAPGGAAFADVWAGLDGAARPFETVALDASVVCDPTFATWFVDFGVRGLACVAAQTVAPAAPATLVARAPVAPFRSGPHAVSASGVDLDLDADRAFGHYDPAFVRWLADAAVPTGPAAVLAAPVYRRHVARLARVYWLTHADLAAAGFPASTPDGPLADYARYLDGGPVPDGMEAYESQDGFSVYAFTDRSERLVDEIGLPVGNEWEIKYEANTAYGFWLRRRADGTHAEWRDALQGLLRAYDADWLAAR